MIHPAPATARAIRWLLASLVLVWMSTTWWAAAIDDVWITLAFAHELVEHGRLTWSTGEAVEAYSHVLWLAYLTAAVQFGLDGSRAALWGSLAGAVALLAVASWAAPVDRRGHALLAALAVWHPLVYWSAMGLEGPAYAALLAAGWVLALRRSSWVFGCALMALAWGMRPEGVLHMAAVLSLRPLLGPRTRRDAGILAVLALLAAYHAVRIGYFGYFWATPTVVKVGHPSVEGALQWGAELAVSLGVLGVAALGWSAGRRRTWLAVLPLLIQGATLWVAGGDWMAHGRLSFPGVAATAIAWASLGTARPGSWALVAALWPLALWSPSTRWQGWEAPPLQAWSSPWEHATARTFAPLEDHMRLLIEEVPWGRTVMLYDVGLPGHIEGLRVLDGVGLVSNEFARSAHSVHASEPDQFGDDGIYLWLRTDYEGAQVRLSDEVQRRLPFEERRLLGGVHSVVLRADQQRPTPSQIRQRWCGLAARFPTLRGYPERCQTARIEEGTLSLEAVESPARVGFAGGSVPLQYVEGRGFAMYWNGELLSVPLTASMQLELSADDPRDEGALVELAWPGCEDKVETVSVRESFKRTVDPPCAGARLAVRFLNDASGDGWDRNLYARLDGAGAAPSARTLIASASMPLTVEVDRGIAMRWNGELVSVPLQHGVDLALDVDHPREAGAQLELQWDSCDTTPWVVHVRAPVVHRLEPPCVGSRLAMRYLNDGSGATWDRDLYVWLREASEPEL